MEESPVRGPTLSTSTSSSFEAMDPHDPNLSKLATKMFKKTEEYISNELNAPIDDYKLLEDMNRVSLEKYTEMTHTANSLAISTLDLKNKFDELRSQLNYIDEIEDTVDKLEAAAYKLDAYSVALENKIKTMIYKSSQ
ncbi:biogenesis of lysosome-related organelles complex 1 subunit 2 isoform X1 [Condylostylus longicornis]|uniref:biogenesis of lysosome-related organelles complex 1 subunit 2 isoform X1 n=1 Tax=Condylostylus longicornis TaxID=2530218 RepID=UPI00244E2276|nr:biogenesis of lysosome-related organelles complex 1 subunit 2 isoform X1 [Condylostylus longicornis]